MPRGFPPWFGQSVFATKGSIQLGQINGGSIVHQTQSTLFTLTGKGEFFGGDLAFSFAGAAANLNIELFVDGIDIGGVYLNVINLFLPLGMPKTNYIYLIAAASPLYTVEISRGIVFSTSFAIKVTNFEVAIDVTAVNMYYAWNKVF
jgi:hypothetical protein